MQETLRGYKKVYDEKTVSVLDEINIPLNCAMTSSYAYSIILHGLDLAEKQCEDNIEELKGAVKKYPNLTDLLETEKEILRDITILQITALLNVTKNESN